MHWRGELDMMRFCPGDIPGVTLPQLYLKVPGVWTGGHEENLRCVPAGGKAKVHCTTHALSPLTHPSAPTHPSICPHSPSPPTHALTHHPLLSHPRLTSVNICHQGASEWGAIHARHTPRLRHIVQQKYGVDIYDNKIAWFPSQEFCEKHGIPATFGVQRAGDVVVLDGEPWCPGAPGLRPAPHSLAAPPPTHSRTHQAPPFHSTRMRDVVASATPMKIMCRLNGALGQSLGGFCALVVEHGPVLCPPGTSACAC
jgi:hypothetical protein